MKCDKHDVLSMWILKQESQGFTRSQSRSRLLYDFEKDDQDETSPEKLTEILEEVNFSMACLWF